MDSKIRKAVLIPNCEIKVKLLRWGMNEQDYINRLIENGLKKEIATKKAQSVFRPTLDDDDLDRRQYQQLKEDNCVIDFQNSLESMFDSSVFPTLETIKEEG